MAWCGCHGQTGNVCRPQYGGTCTSQMCNVRSGGVISPSRPKINWTDPVLNSNVKIKAIHIKEIRNAVAAELSARKLSGINTSTPSGEISAGAYVEIKNALNQLRRHDGYSDFYFPDSYAPGALITGSGTAYFRQYLNILQDVCMCQCNYDCSCNCNYCTCNCNYCICQCNWGCPCDCNYSDKNLKENIEYF